MIAPLLLTVCLAILPSDSPQPPGDDQAAATLRLSDGTLLVGRIVSETDGMVRVATDLLGEVAVPADAVVERIHGVATHETAPGPVTPPAAAPIPPAAPAGSVSWTRTIGIGGSFVSAPYEQDELDGNHPGYTGAALGLPGEQVNAQLTLSLVRNAPGTVWALSSSGTYVDAKPAGRLTEGIKINSIYTHAVRGSDFLYSNTSFRRDGVRNIDNSIVQAFGVGRRFIDTPARKFDVMPGIMLQREEKGTTYDKDVLLGYGFAESFTAANASGVMFDQRLVARTLVEDASLYWLESYLGVRAPLTKRLMLQVGLQFDHDEMLGLQETEIPGTGLSFFANKKSTLQLTTGLQMSF